MQNGIYYYILEEKRKLQNKNITKNIRYLGSAKKVLSDLKELDLLRQRKP